MLEAVIGDQMNLRTLVLMESNPIEFAGLTLTNQDFVVI